MIIYPTNAFQAKILADFMLAHAFTQPLADMHYVGWAEEEHGKPVKLQMVVGLGGFMGSVCNIHVAMAPGFHFTPKIMLERVFQHAFEEFKVKKLIGIVNSLNEKAMKYDLHLGFVEEHRIVGMHDDGGDIVILSMTPEQCRYLKRIEAA